MTVSRWYVCYCWFSIGALWNHDGKTNPMLQYLIAKETPGGDGNTMYNLTASNIEGDEVSRQGSEGPN